ncbi:MULTISPECIES: hypothetical protein [Thermodesulfovibrio]|jgi:hypothetical protein|uniref:hypothetical protein n=1 Tax=Thermodesulfovibrio TaxID=28261 RepID=UPI00262ED122|nr:hypothetical protein [Thermodesulfovibrio sp.]
MKKLALLIFTTYFFISALPIEAINCCYQKPPYGSYCPGKGSGWYGAKKAVNTTEDARKILNEYFKNQGMVIDNIKERKWFFQAEIRDKNNNLIDVLIVDKRTGRIRSTY